MTTGFNVSNLPRHIHVARDGRGTGGTPMAALVCEVCGAEEHTVDTPEALRESAGRFVPVHMDCTPDVGEDE